MRALVYLLIAGALLSVLKAAVTVVLLAIALLALWGALFRPAEMARLIAFVVFWWLLQNQLPAALALIAIGLIPARRQGETLNALKN